MSEYKGIKGFNVQTRAGNPDDPIIGDFFYDSASGQFKNIADGFLTGTWSSSSALNTARYRMNGGFGTSPSAVVVVGGQSPAKNDVEQYNGTSWTEVGDYPAATSDNGCTGVTTAGLSVCGVYDGPVNDECFTWNGSAFTEVADYPAGHGRVVVTGTTTAALSNAGEIATNPSNWYDNKCYDFNGSAWTEAGDYPIYKSNGGMAGTQTAAIVAGGYGGPNGSIPGAAGRTICATYDGSSWTEIAELNQIKTECGYSGAGTTTSMVVCAGPTPTNAVTELWNGTAWSEGNDLATGRGAGGSAGTMSSMLYAGGTSPALSPTTSALTEEWSQSDTNIKTVTTS